MQGRMTTLVLSKQNPSLFLGGFWPFKRNYFDKQQK